MFKREMRVFRVLLILVLALALSAVYVTNAQSTALTQIVSTADGQISAHLPAGWLVQDTSSDIYSSVLAFGDSATTLKAAVDSVTTQQTTVIAGMNGVVGIISPTVLGTTAPDTAIQTLFNSLLNSVKQSGGTILGQQNLSLGNGAYDAVAALADSPDTQTEGIFGAFTNGTLVAVFTIGATPEATFTAGDNSNMLASIVDSFRIPAEAGSTPANSQTQTQTQPTAVPSNNTNNTQTNGSAGTETVSVGQNGTFSVDLPQGWVNETRGDVSNFSAVIVFGTDQAALQIANSAIVNGSKLPQFQGVAGFIGAADLSQLGGAQISTLIDPLMQRLSANATSSGATTVGSAQAENFGGKYPGELQELNIGYIAVLHSSDQLLVGIIFSDDKASNDSLMENILESIQIPAAAPSSNTQQQQQQQQPTTVATTEEAPAETQTFRSSDNQVSLDLPSNWTVLDHIADGAILAYGDTPDAAMSRLYSVKPSLATKTVISGNGGVVALYPMSQFGIDPSNPNLTPLMQRVLSNLQGYTVSQQPQAVPGLDGAVYAIISGTEHGYLVLIPFGNQIAYVTATGTTEDEFTALQTTFQNIVASIHVPALPIPTPVPTAAGLGGLGGLESTEEATPEVTPTEAAGLGGLGGFASPVGTPNATPES